MASKLDSALALARQGFKIFPLAPGRKDQPLLADWPALATSDENLISLQWGPTGTPDANIGIHCEGLLVVDVDIHKGGIESFKQLDGLLGFPNTRTHGTPTGGLHAVYRLPDGHPGVPNSVEELAKGLDVRSTGGYVVAPGSQVGVIVNPYHVAVDEPIAAAPPWLVQRLGMIVPKAPAASVPDAPEHTFQRAADWLRTAERSVKGAGGDQAAYRVACALRDMGLSYQQACEAMRSEAWDYGCGWREGRLEDKPIRSAYKYAQHEQGGSRGVVEDDLPLPTELGVKPLNAQKTRRGRLVRADAFAAEAGSGPGYILKNLLNRASYVVAYGAPGAGKTFVLLDIGYHVANSKPWMGMLVRGGPVLYLAYEGVGGLKKRARALQKKYGDALGELYIVGATMNLREQAGRQELGQIIAEMPEPPVLVVVDTFARALMGGDENSAQDVGALNDAIAKLIDHTGACVVMIHHSGKNKSAGARGSSAILGAIDTELEIDNGQVVPSKQRDLEIIPPVPFKLRPVVVGTDEDGEDEKSCVVEPSQGGARTGKPLTGQAEHAFSVLCEMTGEANAPVSRALWVAKMKDEGLGRSAAYNWPRKLQRLGKVTIEDDYCTRRLT